MSFAAFAKPEARACSAWKTKKQLVTQSYSEVTDTNPAWVVSLFQSLHGREYIRTVQCNLAPATLQSHGLETLPEPVFTRAATGAKLFYETCVIANDVSISNWSDVEKHASTLVAVVAQSGFKHVWDIRVQRLGRLVSDSITQFLPPKSQLVVIGLRSLEPT